MKTNNQTKHTKTIRQRLKSAGIAWILVLALCMGSQSMASEATETQQATELQKNPETQQDAIETESQMAETQFVEQPATEQPSTMTATLETDLDASEAPSLLALTPPAPVQNLKAKAAGKKRVILTWIQGSSQGSAKPEGYLIYAQKDGVYGYAGMTGPGTPGATVSYTDTKALSTDYNFYWVFPYIREPSGKMICGPCTSYVYAKGICPAVTNLRAGSVTGGVRIAWTTVKDAEGYLIYGIVGDKPYGYVGMTTQGDAGAGIAGKTVAYTDYKASEETYNFYWVYPYFRERDGSMTAGHTAKYTYGIAGKINVAAPSNSGRLRVNGTKLVNEQGKQVQLKGISTHGIAWYPQYIDKTLWHEFRTQWGVNVMRLAMYTAEYGGYCSGGNQNDLKKLVKTGVQYATENDMYVIIDWHILSDSNPKTNMAAAKTFFAEMAKTYAGYKNVMYEICNEPNGSATWEDIRSYANQIISIIRTYDKQAIIIVGTPNWSQYVDQAAAKPLSGTNLMYTLHFYADTHRDSLRNTMVKAVQAGLPIFVTEYGICDASGSGAINDAEAQKWIKLMDQYGISYVAWNLSNKAETSAILKSSCTKTHGFTTNDLSSSGRWLYDHVFNSR